MKQYNYKEVEKILRKNGWEYDRGSGDHAIYIKDRNHISIPVKRNPNMMLLRRLFKENNICEVK